MGVCSVDNEAVADQMCAEREKFWSVDVLQLWPLQKAEDVLRADWISALIYANCT